MIFFKVFPLANNNEFVWGFYVDPSSHPDRKKFETTLNSYFPKIRLSYAYTQQIHSHFVKKVEKPGIYEKTDALGSSVPNLVLSVYTADCLPIIMFLPQQKHFGIAHAGWKGTKEKIIIQLYKTLTTEKYPVFIDFLPHICSECYIVGSEFQDYFSPPSLSHQEGQFYFSLTKENEIQLKTESIHYSYLMQATQNPKYKNICTFTHKELPSYRRDKSSGRIFSFCFLLSPEP